MNIYLIALLLLTLAWKVSADCRKPPVYRNVRVHYPSGENGRRPLPELAIIRFSCHPGYVGIGDNLIVCYDSQWRSAKGNFDKKPNSYRCREKSCPLIPPVNGRVDIEDKKVFYSCNIGYRLVGPREAMCRINRKGDYYVTLNVPVCEKLSMCKCPDIPNLQFDEKAYYDNDTINFSCPSGYILEGQKTLTCDNTGSWDGILPICVLVPKCTDPGIAKFSNRKGNCCEIGTEVKYTCEPGYVFLDSALATLSITCLENEEWSGRRPICKPIEKAVCNNPPEENNLEIEFEEDRSHPDIFLSGDTIDFACKENYHTNDPSLSLTCQDDGLWDSPIPFCSPMDPCKPPKVPANGIIVELYNAIRDSFAIGYEINVECDEGYEVKSGLYSTRCIGNTWKEELENCTIITCADPGIPENGMRMGSDFQFGQSVKFNCMGNSQLIGSEVRTCQKNGRWSGHTVACDFGGTDCPSPGIPINSYREGNNFNIGDVVTYTCKSGYTMMQKNGTRICLDTGYWSGDEIECYGVNEHTNAQDAMDILDSSLTILARSAQASPVRIQLGRSGIGVVEEANTGGVNVFFIIDVSGSITKRQFNHSKEFTKFIIKKVGISEQSNGVRAGVITFSSEATEIFSTNIKDTNVAIQSIDNLVIREAQGTNIQKALLKLEELLNAQEQNIENRRLGKSLVFLITDGQITEGGTPTDDYGRITYLYNVKIYTIAVGQKPDLETLKAISSQHLLFANHKELVETVEAAIGHKIDFSPCGLERPTYNIQDESKRKKRSAELLGRIVGGTKVYQPWPWMAALQMTTNALQHVIGIKARSCGGSIIHYQWILTAAHCFVELREESQYRVNDNILLSPQSWKVIVGRTDLTLESGLEFQVTEIIFHPQYNKETFDYDIALMKVRQSIPFDHFTRPICLPPIFEDVINSESKLYQAKQMATVIGWGHEKVLHVNSSKLPSSVNKLNELVLPLQNDELCLAPFNYTVCRDGQCHLKTETPTEQMLCAGNGKGGQDACGGDSGGPLMQQVLSESRSTQKGRWFVIGVVSWGVGCGMKDFYGYYTHVSKMREWIGNITGDGIEDVVLKN